MNARETVLDLLIRWTKTRRLADALLEEVFSTTQFSASDRAFVTELFYGCLRNQSALRFLSDQLAERPPRPLVAHMLQLGLYQLFYLKTPPHAAVHETVELAKRRATIAEAKFLNAILRKAARICVANITPISAVRETTPWVFFSHPRWLWERWMSRWGAEQTAALCDWNNRPPPLYLRLNTLKSSVCPPDAPVRATQFHPLIFEVTDASRLLWERGEFYAQDPSTLLAVDALDPQPGESVLDLCAAPGGKTTYIAQKMENRGRIVAFDRSLARLCDVRENCRRLGVMIVTTTPVTGISFDRVLVDAPCSNTGVMRRRVDLRWRIQQDEIARLSGVQEQLLARAGRATKPGGVLVYSTCSLEAEENERVVERFREAYPEFSLETTRSTFPPCDGVDGAFIARFRRG